MKVVKTKALLRPETPIPVPEVENKLTKKGLLLLPALDTAFSEKSKNFIHERMKDAGFKVEVSPRMEINRDFSDTLKASLQAVADKVNRAKKTVLLGSVEKYETIVVGMHGSPKGLSLTRNGKHVRIADIESGAFSHLKEYLSEEGIVVLDSCEAGVERFSLCFANGLIVEENVAMALSLYLGKEVKASLHPLRAESIVWKEGIAHFHHEAAGNFYSNSFHVNLSPGAIEKTVNRFCMSPTLLKKILNDSRSSVLTNAFIINQARRATRVCAWGILNLWMGFIVKPHYTLEKKKAVAMKLVEAVRLELNEHVVESRYQALSSFPMAQYLLGAFQDEGDALKILKEYAFRIDKLSVFRDTVSWRSVLNLDGKSEINRRLMCGALSLTSFNIEASSADICRLFDIALKYSSVQLLRATLSYTHQLIVNDEVSFESIGQAKFFRAMLQAEEMQDPSALSSVEDILSEIDSKQFQKLFVKSIELDNVEAMQIIIKYGKVQVRGLKELCPLTFFEDLLLNVRSKSALDEVKRLCTNGIVPVPSKSYLRAVERAIDSNDAAFMETIASLKDIVPIALLHASNNDLNRKMLRIVFKDPAQSIGEMSALAKAIASLYMAYPSFAMNGIQLLTDFDLCSFVLDSVNKQNYKNLQFLQLHTSMSTNKIDNVRLLIKVMRALGLKHRENLQVLKHLTPVEMPAAKDIICLRESRWLANFLIEVPSPLDISDWIPFLSTFQNGKHLSQVIDKFICNGSHEAPLLDLRGFTKAMSRVHIENVLKKSEMWAYLKKSRSKEHFPAMCVFVEGLQRAIKSSSHELKKKHEKELKKVVKLCVKRSSSTDIYVLEVMKNIFHIALICKISLKLPDAFVMRLFEKAQSMKSTELEEAIFEYYKNSGAVIKKSFANQILEKHTAWKKKISLQKFVRF